jgi:hypothetical protein
MSKIDVAKIGNMAREPLIFLWRELFTEPITSRTSVSFSVIYWPSKFSGARIVCPVYYSNASRLLNKNNESYRLGKSWLIIRVANLL